MCGICGKVVRGAGGKAEERELRRMTDAIRHRGPDDEGFVLDGRVGLGFRRLSIIDLSTGHQPIPNEDRTAWIIFNGEVYNFQELRHALEQRGHRFSTNTDTEAILHAYEEYGDECVGRLRGMFAFAIWDAKRQRLFCARDRFGIKPFYFYLDDHQFAFGSELKAITAADGVDRTIDPQALDSYLTYGYIIGDRTIYRRVRKLEPAHTLVVEGRTGWTPVTHRYWHPVFAPDHSRTEDDWCEEIEAVLSETVKMHMISDVPLGAFLSGGIDSSSVVALMSRHSAQPVKTFSIGFQDRRFNELEFARDVARAYGTEHHEKIVEPESIDMLPRLVRAYDQPYADSSAIPTFFVSRLAREHVTVALSGDGGDELFAGYNKYKKFRSIHDWNLLPGPLRKGLWGGLHGLLPDAVRGKGITYLLSRHRDAGLAYNAIWNLQERQRLFRPELWEQVHRTPAEGMVEELLRGSQAADILSRMQEVDLGVSLPDDMLTKVDIASMQHSLEVRVPMLDHVFAELTFRIPPGLKLRRGTTKHIFKRAMASQLPPSVLSHRKQGFGVPLEAWFKSDLKPYVEERLGPNNRFLGAYLDMQFVGKTVRQHHEGMRDFSWKIWTLLFLSEWLEHNERSAGKQ
jgi:asparagine synthase (glutamine-hydrolysing)